MSLEYLVIVEVQEAMNGFKQAIYVKDLFVNYDIYIDVCVSFDGFQKNYQII